MLGLGPDVMNGRPASIEAPNFNSNRSSRRICIVDDLFVEFLPSFIFDTSQYAQYVIKKLYLHVHSSSSIWQPFQLLGPVTGS